MSFPMTSSPEAPALNGRPEDARRANALSLASAVRAHLKGDTSGALSALRSNASPAGDTAEVVAARAHLHLELKQFAEAAAEYEKLAALRPSYAEGQYQWGASLYQLGRFDQALERFLRCAEMDGSRADLPLMFVSSVSFG